MIEKRELLQKLVEFLDSEPIEVEESVVAVLPYHSRVMVSFICSPSGDHVTFYDVKRDSLVDLDLKIWRQSSK